jgi:Domain of unknown function (DUF3127)
MSKSFEVQGVIHSIGDTTEYGKNGFTKREFVIQLTGEGENSNYPNYVALELVKDKCALMDGYKLGDEISAHFNLSGRLWSGNGKPEKCFTSLQAWKVDGGGSGAAAMGGYDQTPPADFNQAPPADYSQSQSAPSFDDDIPF